MDLYCRQNILRDHITYSYVRFEISVVLNFNFLFFFKNIIQGNVFDDAVGNNMGMDCEMGTWRSALSHLVIFPNIRIVPIRFHIDLHQRR